MRGLVREKAIIMNSIAIMIFSIIIGGFIYYFASNAIVANISESLTEIAVLGAKAVENNLKGNLEVIETIAAEEPIKDPNIPLEEKVEILKAEVKRNGFARMSIADLSGNSLTTEGVRLYVGDRDYFKLAKEGKKNISDPLVSRVDNTLSITLAVPIISDDDIIGVLYSTSDIEFLSKITDEIKLGEYGRSFIIDGMGATIAHELRDQVNNRVNLLLDWKKLGYHKSLYEFFISMQQNEKGAGQYIFEGTRRYAGYAKIQGTNWYFGISAPRSQVFRSINRIYAYLGILVLITIAVFSASQFNIRVLRKNLSVERNMSAAVIDTANIVIIGLNKDGIIQEFNSNAEIKLGYKRNQVLGNMRLSDMVDLDSMDSYNKLIDHINNGEELNSLELSLKNADGTVVYMIWNLNFVKHNGDKYVEIVGIDISERIKIEKELVESHEELTSLYEELYASEETLRQQYDELSQKEKEIYKLAYYDHLTGLANRINAEQYFNYNIKDRKNNAALFYMDLDNFKYVNDTFGHSIGDELLIKVAENIKSVINENYIAARLGGDEFMIVIDDYRDLRELENLAERLLKSFESSFKILDSMISISTSIGIALYPDNGDNFRELMKCADIAMYVAKESGKNTYAFFDEKINEKIVRRMKIQNSMKDAIKDKEFALYYQPQYNISTGTIKGFEALLRWNSSQHGFVSPSEFIGIAETSGLIVPLGNWVLDEACSFIKKVIDMGYEDISISVNVSVIQLMQDDFVENVNNALKRYGLKPSNLELEITESLLMENIDLNLKRVRALRSLGVGISLDDFGTGYSSLTYLRYLPIDILKIDKTFIDNILDAGEKNCLTGTIITLAHDLGLSVIAEGVEEEKQLKYLKRYDCDMVQGYLFSKPLPIQEAMDLLLSSSSNGERSS